MDQIITPELISTVTTLLTLVVAGVPIGFLTFIFVQVGKWSGLFGSFGGFGVRKAALAHAGLLGALWIAIQFFPQIVPYVSIVILGLYGAMVAALTYDKVWAKIAGALGINYASEQFQLAVDQRDADKIDQLLTNDSVTADRLAKVLGSLPFKEVSDIPPEELAE